MNIVNSPDIMDCSNRKRSKVSRVTRVETFEDLVRCQDHIGEELSLGFYVNIEMLLDIMQNTSFGPYLKSLEIHPPFDDHNISPDLRLSHPALYCPSLERLQICNHSISCLVMDERCFPRLRELYISHPLGVSIDTFRISCPNTLEEVTLEYLTVRDGQGLCNALNYARHPKLHSVRKFGITTYLQGIV